MFALKRDSKKIETAAPVVYGTAFPIAPGLFATAAHVWTAAQSDGIPILSRIPRNLGPLVPLRINAAEVVPAIDLALIRCDDLANVTPFPIDFDRTLTIHDQVSAVGFPMATDPEWVSIIHRGFAGTVITRREMYHIGGQPPGYEVSFFAPQGMSGAPLVSTVRGDHRCYGYIVQQSTIGTADMPTPVGIAVDIKVLLGVNSKILGRPLAEIYGREPMEFHPTPAQLPGGVRMDTDITDWPDDTNTDWPDDTKEE